MVMPKHRREGTRDSVGSAEFKARCLELIDRVRESHAEYVVTRHGRPVARLVPVERFSPAEFMGSMRGSVLGYDRPFDPIPGGWDVNAAAPDDDK
jgi:prevent-host-death family protein